MFNRMVLSVILVGILKRELTTQLQLMLRPQSFMRKVMARFIVHLAAYVITQAQSILLGSTRLVVEA